MRIKEIITTGILLSSVSTCFADEQKLTGAEIEALLPTIKASGPSYTQTFSKKGLTTYVFDGRPSEGRWSVQSDQYCSTWPPNDIVECYDVLVDKTQQTITWIGARNAISKGTYKFLKN